MGRTRSFDEAEVLGRAAKSFLATGFEGTSLDDLVRSTGLHRGSLYQAFGSKRGLFVAALRARSVPAEPGDPGREEPGPGRGEPAVLDLLLVATLELAPRDTEVRSIVGEWLADRPDAAVVLGTRLLDRAGLGAATPAPAPVIAT
ncbi:helix-turn-helix transcriptional regulator [Nakamurella flavida]|uniref:Helix-turn-helix transcriptional regulator n=1 Tax=Nakamurella flavida TaxID=363630 RepID=A0A938YNC5_9ACTN|nr:helix-turn-helix domain-containing protein [Nakamurella flavida]MBM9477716.1 helix-turn-helix transcriptional regulator [Nakamurella flavida]MDP9779268.1 AcrR family transcriptional regulator [Nakamurella flavida]